MCEMDDSGHGGGNGNERVTLPLEALIDELVLTFDRRDGTLKVGGRILNIELGLMIAQRAVNYFETLVRVQAAAQMQQQQADKARVAALLDRARHERS
jgi:hypothetical protein